MQAKLTFVQIPAITKTGGVKNRFKRGVSGLMKLAIGIVLLFAFIYWGVPFFFQAMKKHDFDTMYYGIQDAKRAAGATSDLGQRKKFMTYGERYARGIE